MENIEEDSFDELSVIMAAIREADMHVVVHDKAVVYHHNAMLGAKQLAATAHRRSQAQRQLYRETVGKFAGIFAAASEAGISQHESEIKEEGRSRGNSAIPRVLPSIPTVGKAESIKQEEGNPSIDGFRRESSDNRIQQWRLQASAISVPEEDTATSTVAVGSDPDPSNHPGGPFGPPPYASPMGPPPLPPLPPQRMHVSASCNNISQLHARDALNPFYGPRRSMQSAPEIPSMPAPVTYQTHAMKSRAASKKAFDILAAQIQHREREEKRQREQGGSSEGRKSESSRAFL